MSERPSVSLHQIHVHSTMESLYQVIPIWSCGLMNIYPMTTQDRPLVLSKQLQVTSFNYNLNNKHVHILARGPTLILFNYLSVHS